MPNTQFAGVDEVGRGALFGMVTAAAVILSPSAIESLRDAGVKDSKQLSAKRRERLAIEIQAVATSYCVASADVAEIDRLNILQASLLAMKRAIRGLSIVPDLCLIDGNRSIPDLQLPQQTIVGGDRVEISIAAASILAKVARDRAIIEYDRLYPAYDLARNKGYGSPHHLAALTQYGVTIDHRQSFAPVRLALKAESERSLG
jgi:ribonuclease HII